MNNNIMDILIIAIGLLLAFCIKQNRKIKWLKDELDIVKSNNSSLKRVMYENNLIPKDYVK